MHLGSSGLHEMHCISSRLGCAPVVLSAPCQLDTSVHSTCSSSAVHVPDKTEWAAWAAHPSLQRHCNQQLCHPCFLLVQVKMLQPGSPREGQPVTVQLVVRSNPLDGSMAVHVTLAVRPEGSPRQAGKPDGTRPPGAVRTLPLHGRPAMRTVDDPLQQCKSIVLSLFTFAK